MERVKYETPEWMKILKKELIKEKQKRKKDIKPQIKKLKKKESVGQIKELSEDKIYLKPWELLNVEGKLSYNDGSRAWSVLRFKKEIITEFPQLKERRSKLFYNVVLTRNYDALLSFIKNMKNENKPLPLLVQFYKLKDLPSTIQK